MKSIAAGSLIAATLLSAGCAAQRTVRKDAPLEVSASSEAPRALEQPPASPKEADAGAKPKTTPEEPRRQERLHTLVLTGANARELFLSLARQNDLNLVLSPEVSGSVTLDIKRATASEVMEEACVVVGCRVEYAGRMVRVLPDRPDTRFFEVDYLLTTRSGKGTLNAKTSAGAGSGAGGSSSGGGGESESSVLTEEKVDFYDSLLEEVKSLLSGAEARAVLNRTTGTLAVTDRARNLQKVAAYLHVLSARSRTGVMIEAKILEVTLDDASQYGIDWSAMPSLRWASLSGSLAGGAVVGQSLASGATSGIQIGVTGSHVNGFLDALATFGKLNVLSAPRVATLNNQKAIIRIGRQDVFFRATLTPATTTSAAIVTYNPDTVTEGIILAVTPQVARGGQVMLSIHPSITEKVGTATAPDRNTAPIIDVRETNTVVSVDDGQTIVIGGLMQERTQETVKSVPILGDIPWLGALFRNVVQTKRKTELVILIRPRIVPPASLAGLAEEDVRRMQSLERGNHLGGRPGLYGAGAEAKGFEAW
jgi:MSHA biogenesis protein MshL